MNETATQFEVHPKTGLPIQPVPAFKVGDLVTESFLSDGYPGVVVAATAKTVYVGSVKFLGNFSADDAPGYNGYGDSGSIVVDPESVEQAIAKGKDAATKYVLRVAPKPSVSGTSGRERDTYGEAGFHRAGWRLPNSRSGSLSAGARYRQDPHV